MTGRCTRWERWLPGSGGRLKVLNWNLHSFKLLEIIQVLDSISWVRCASGNVCICESKSLEGPLVLPADPGHVREFLMIFPLISNKLFRFSPQTRTRRRPVSFFLTYLARTTCFPGLKSRQLN